MKTPKKETSVFNKNSTFKERTKNRFLFRMCSLKNPKKERKNEKSYPVSDVFIHTCCVFIISGYVFRSIPLLFYMCMRMTSSLRSIAGVPSGRTLPSYPITSLQFYAFLVLEG